MSHPSLFEVVIEKARIGYRWRVEKNGEIVKPFDEPSRTLRALTLRSARHKAACWIERACTAPKPPELRVNGSELLKQVEIERFVDSVAV